MSGSDIGPEMLGEMLDREAARRYGYVGKGEAQRIASALERIATVVENEATFKQDPHRKLRSGDMDCERCGQTVEHGDSYNQLELQVAMDWHLIHCKRAK